MEATILLALQSLRLPVLTQLAALVSAFGNYAFIWVVIGILLIVFAHRNDVGITVIFTVILAGIIVGFILQPMFAHVRPYDAGIGVSAVMGVSRTGYSFPSFHAATSFAAATVIAMIAGRRWGSWAFVGAVLISLSRVYLGVEWPSTSSSEPLSAFSSALSRHGYTISSCTTSFAIIPASIARVAGAGPSAPQVRRAAEGSSA